ncbi:MAG TPA: hypothetical protein PKD85_04120, partial [Saprospiraceae bacterium]|nr:hypothetical protein [Saprospiraceae bacterium]
MTFPTVPLFCLAMIPGRFKTGFLQFNWKWTNPRNQCTKCGQYGHNNCTWTFIPQPKFSKEDVEAFLTIIKDIFINNTNKHDTLNNTFILKQNNFNKDNLYLLFHLLL